MNKTALMDMNQEELAVLMEEAGEKPYRARQLYAWLLAGARPEEMHTLPKTLREYLKNYPHGGARIEEKHVSARDGTVKYLFALDDGALVEGVLMRYHHGNTLCLSTQVGCRMGCVFCASTLDGVLRNIRHGEMLGMVAAVERDEPHEANTRAVTNIVLMGSGEPLDNYEHVVTFLWRVTAAEGMGISPRNISLSTCGLVEKIKTLADDAPHVTLCISLHAHSDAVRDTLLPINRAHPISELMEAAKEYASRTGRRLIFEYALIAGVNDTAADAAALAALLKGINCHVNLIPLNPVRERALAGTSRAEAQRFLEELTRRHTSATIRREMGTDIEGACGQLRRRVMEERAHDR
ncbi:23S rRNA (adenine(2503)-C(2))-methyltransferase RlmN [Christensenellaceae bacterium OttesenSCG-928-L17]|nr:23S rRNA (adenine(2503)-C(2))-methyltransferase RlmN [Christensenellaceae bacterium OttesenSCG-928-L17]